MLFDTLVFKLLEYKFRINLYFYNDKVDTTYLHVTKGYYFVNLMFVGARDYITLRIYDTRNSHKQDAGILCEKQIKWYTSNEGIFKIIAKELGLVL